MSALLEGRGLAVAYGPRPIFSGLDLSVEAGRFTALVGPNGAGKSSLLRVLAGVQKPNAGTVQRHARAALIATALSLPPDVTPAQLSSYLIALRAPWWQLQRNAAERTAIAAALQRTGLTDRADDPAENLSDGELQRAWIAAALATGADALLIDEPTTHLDVRYQLEILSMLKTLARAGHAVFVAIHDLTLAARFADSIALLAGGALQVGTPDEVLKSEILVPAFGVGIETRRDSEGYIVCVPR
jgi:iron complex transport system ATP-binding protein